MTDRVHKALEEYEQKLADGKIITFIVKITASGLCLETQPASAETPLTLPLTEELHTSLQIFFSDIDGVAYGSFDYATLRSLLNAHSTIERMTGNPPR